MDDAGDLIFTEDLLKQRFVPHIALVEADALAGDALHPLQTLRIGIDQIVDDHHLIAAFQQLHAGVRADITGTAGDQNLHNKPPKM